MAMNRMWTFVGGMVIGLTTFSIARGAVPVGSMHVTDDTALYQQLSEIKAPREGRMDFDADIQQLARLKPRYRERLPVLAKDPRLAGPMSRIAAQAYRPAKAKAGKARASRATRN